MWNATVFTANFIKFSCEINPSISANSEVSCYVNHTTGNSYCKKMCVYCGQLKKKTKPAFYE